MICDDKPLSNKVFSEVINSTESPFILRASGGMAFIFWGSWFRCSYISSRLYLWYNVGGRLVLTGTEGLTVAEAAEHSIMDPARRSVDYLMNAQCTFDARQLFLKACACSSGLPPRRGA